MSLEKQASSEKIKEFLRAIHPSTTQDINCENAEWMAEDLAHCPGVGEWKCQSQSYEIPGEYGQGDSTTDYKPCNCLNHLQCPIYNVSKK